MAVVIVIIGWEDHQHYKDRDPPWVKLHRKMLTSESWMNGTNLTRVIQIASILLAPRYGNKIPCDPELLRKAGSVDGSDAEIRAALAQLVEYNFIDIQEVADLDRQAAIRLLARCSSEAEAEAEAEAEQDCTAARTPPGSFAIDLLAVGRGTQRPKRERNPEPEWAAAFKAVYPKRNGDPNWRGAWRAGNARLQQRRTVEQFMAGAQRYAAWCQATGKVGQETVMQASRFLGPDEPFMQSWELAPPRVDPRVATERQRAAETEARNWDGWKRRAAKCGCRDPFDGESLPAYIAEVEQHESRRRTTGPQSAASLMPQLVRS